MSGLIYLYPEMAGDRMEKMKKEFNLELPQILYFVKASCHENLHDTLNDLKDMTDAIQISERNNPDFPSKLGPFLKTFILNLKRHLALEENNFFPMVEAGRKQFRSYIPNLVDDHDHIKIDLLEIRRMTENYQAKHEDTACAQFYQKLSDMDRILLNHIQIEDHVLFPMVEAL